MINKWNWWYISDLKDRCLRYIKIKITYLSESNHTKSSESVFPAHGNQKDAVINSWYLLNIIMNLNFNITVNQRCLKYSRFWYQRSLNFHFDIAISKEGPFDHSVTEVQNEYVFVFIISSYFDFAALIKENLKPCGLILDVIEEPIVCSWNNNIAILKKTKSGNWIWWLWFHLMIKELFKELINLINCLI